MNLNEIKNFSRINDSLATAGQPSEEQIRAIAANRYSVVINLGLIDPRYCLDDEAGLVRSLGMAYHHIPVDFEAPDQVDLVRFFEIMNDYPDQKVFVHCAANYRVSVFVALFGQKEWNWPVSEADEHIRRIWNPDVVWTSFIEESRRRLDLKD